ncbi:MAG: ABC transporter permease [Flammeovirgaceae bacterium]
MIRHLVKLIWNKRRKNSLLITEIALSFFVFFAVLSFAIYNFNNYLQPLGFAYEDVWVINMEWGNNGEKAPSLLEKQSHMIHTLQQFSEIEEFTFSGYALPFSQSSSRSTVKLNDVEVSTSVFHTTPNYDKTMNLNLLEGRWYHETDLHATPPSIVVNQLLKDKLMPDGGSIIGQEISFGGDVDYRVIGLIDHFRSVHEFQEPPNVAFMQVGDTSFVPNCILLKVSSSADVYFEEKLLNDLTQIAPNWTFELEYLDEKRIIAGKVITIPLILMFTVCGFLIFNVALGLFGVLWYNINQRKSEIGLRRATGASENMITQQFISETWVLATLGILIGTFFAVQFPLLNVFDLNPSIYLLAIGASMILIYLLTTLCAFFPSKQAAIIEPALALHEE